jgi:ketosteroid isomerase-like protein
VPSADEVKEAVERYARAVSSASKEAIMACYDEDVVLQDPYPQPAHTGKEAVSTFWDGVLTMGTPVSFVPDNVVVVHDRAVFLFTTLVDVGEGEGKVRLQVSGYEILTIDDAGRISGQLAYWDPAHMHLVPFGS